MKGNLFKRVTKAILASALALSIALGGNPSYAYAADIKSDDYHVYYNSPGNYSLTDNCEITFYAGTNYFTIDSLSGSAAAKMVTCNGRNVNLSTSVQRTSTGSQRFTCTLKNAYDTTAQFDIVGNNFGTATMYADGRTYYN